MGPGSAQICASGSAAGYHTPLLELQSMDAHFINTGLVKPDGTFEPDGYDLVQVSVNPWLDLWADPLYRVTIDQDNPLTFVEADGTMRRPVLGSYYSDMGSIPVFFQGIPGMGKDRWLVSYAMHDFMCDAGYLWELPEGSTTWQQAPMTRILCDQMLRRMIAAQGASPMEQWVIYRGVRLGAPFMNFPAGFPIINPDGSRGRTMGPV